jgi:hypothetical protein
VQRAYWFLIGVSAIGLVSGILLLPPHFSLLDLLRVLLIFGALSLIGAGLLGRRIAPSTFARPHSLLIVAIVAGCVVSLRSVRTFPNFSATDEAVITNYVDIFQQTGRIELSLIPYDAPTVTGNLYVYAAALWTRLFPNDPYALRSFSTLGGFALLVVVFLAGRSLGDPLTGWIATALLATNLLWMAVAHVGRQEIWLAVFVWCAVWLSLTAQKRQSILPAVLAGVIVALSADVHPLGAYAAAALGVWWLYGYIRARDRAVPPPHRDRRLLFAFILGGLLGTAYYFGAHVLPDPARFVAALHDEAVSYGAEGWTPTAAMLARHLAYLLANPLELGLLIVGSLWALRSARHLGVFLGASLLLYGVTVADPNLYYPVIWITGMVILTAVAVRHASWRWRAPLLVAFTATFVLNATLVERHVIADWNARALDAIGQVAAHVPPNQHGMGESFLYLALRDSGYIGFTYVNFWAMNTGESRWSVVETLKPDWIVSMRDEAAFAPEFGVLSVAVPRMRLEIPDAALADVYTLRETLVTTVGKFEIWERRGIQTTAPNFLFPS